MSDGDRWDHAEASQKMHEQMTKMPDQEDLYAALKHEKDIRQRQEIDKMRDMARSRAGAETWEGHDKVMMAPDPQPDQCKACEELETRLETLEKDFDELREKLGVNDGGTD